MKIFNGIFAFLFLSFAALQYNDPDPLIWIAIYLGMVVVCALALWKKFYRLLALVLGLIYFGYAALLSPSVLVWWQSDDRSELFDELAKMQYLYIEETRECLGLLICLAVLVINFFYFRRLKKLGS
ncbi:MAG: transmembrane 220 family protein [Bacteroidetes bacterium]|nr:transmembrane 220 family protein [Bacteroidota bacterium]